MYPYCDSCECHHPAGRCDLVEELRAEVRTVAAQQRLVTLDRPCQYGQCQDGNPAATHRIIVRSGQTGTVLDDREFCDACTLELSSWRQFEGSAVQSWRLDELDDPQVVREIAEFTAAGACHVCGHCAHAGRICQRLLRDDWGDPAGYCGCSHPLQMTGVTYKGPR